MSFKVEFNEEESVYYKDISFKDRLNSRVVTAENKLRFKPLNIVIDFKDLVIFIQEALKIKREKLKEYRQYYHELLRASRNEAVLIGGVFSKEYLSEQIDKLEDQTHYLSSFYFNKTIGYKDKDYILVDNDPEYKCKTAKNFFDKLGDTYLENLLRSVSIPNYIMGVDKLKITGLSV